MKNALTQEDKKIKEEEVIIVQEETEEDESKIVTTEEELEGFMIVKTILRQKIAVSRIVYRDAQSYFSILLDNNNRKTICRLYFNTTKKYLAIMNENKKENKYELTSLDDIFNYSNELLKAIDNYEKQKEVV